MRRTFPIAVPPMLLHRYGVAMIDLDEAELQSDMDNA